MGKLNEVPVIPATSTYELALSRKKNGVSVKAERVSLKVIG